MECAHTRASGEKAHGWDARWILNVMSFVTSGGAHPMTAKGGGGLWGPEH